MIISEFEKVEMISSSVPSDSKKLKSRFRPLHRTISTLSAISSKKRKLFGVWVIGNNVVI